MLELALMLPVLLAFVFGLVEIGRALSLQNSLQYAAESAARCAAINPADCGTNANIQAYASRQVTEFSVPASAFTVSDETCGHQVLVSYPIQSLANGFVDFSPTLTARACHP